MTHAGRVVDIFFVVTCVVLVAFVVERRVGREGVHAREGVLPTGRSSPVPLPEALKGVPAVLIAVSSTCPFCTDSLSFYRVLAESRRPGGPVIVFVSPESDEIVRRYLGAAGIREPRVVHMEDPSGLVGTPMVIVVDRHGTVRASWAGKLSRSQEKALRAMLSTST